MLPKFNLLSLSFQLDTKTKAGHLAKLREHRLVISVNVETREQSQILQIQAPAGAELVQDLLGILNDVQVKKITTRQPTLEDAYVKLMNGEAKA